MDIADHYPHFTPPPVAPKPSRFVKRGAYMLCLHCNFTSAYCRCAERMRDTPSQDGESSDLARRVRECAP